MLLKSTITRGKEEIVETQRNFSMEVSFVKIRKPNSPLRMKEVCRVLLVKDSNLRE